MVPEDAERLAGRLKLSNAGRQALEDAAGYRGIGPSLDENGVRHALYGRGRPALRNAALMAWAASGAPPPDPGWHALVARISDLAVPAFPLQGADIVQLGLPGGPRVGEILKAVEARWMEGGFTASRDALLETARGLARAGGADR
jgi:hypothetical protein